MITKVITFTNGMVMVFDEHGEQMPEYQGRRNEVWAKIEKDAPPEVKASFSDWNTGQSMPDYSLRPSVRKNDTQTRHKAP